MLTPMCFYKRKKHVQNRLCHTRLSATHLLSPDGSRNLLAATGTDGTRFAWLAVLLLGQSWPNFSIFPVASLAAESLQMLLIWFASNFSFVLLPFPGAWTRRYRHPTNLIFQSSAKAEKSLLQLLLYMSSECARILGKEKGRVKSKKDGKSSRCESF